MLLWILCYFFFVFVNATARPLIVSGSQNNQYRIQYDFFHHFEPLLARKKHIAKCSYEHPYSDIIVAEVVGNVFRGVCLWLCCVC